ncbi:hypothetical protein ACRCUN_06535 [Mycobacterium sp. LTG2003]
MDVSLRPLLTTGVAFVGASAVAMAPITPSWPAETTQVATPRISTEIQLTDIDIPYILTFPIVRQALYNWAQNWVVYLRGLGQAGIGLAQSVVAIPGIAIEIIQELFNLDFVAAFDTFTTAVRDTVVAVGQPLLDSAIWRNQKYLVVQAALSAAWPQAVIDVANGFLDAGGGVANAFIQGTQDLVAAVLTFDLSTIVDAAVDGTRNFLISLGDGARSIVDGIEAAQLGISTALATEPPPPPTFGTSELSTPPVDTTLGLGAPVKTIALDATVASEQKGETVTEAEPETAVKATEESDISPVVDVAEPEPSVEAPKKPVRATPVKDAVKRIEASVKSLSDRVTAGVKKQAEDKKSPEATQDAGDDAKAASSAP